MTAMSVRIIHFISLERVNLSRLDRFGEDAYKDLKESIHGRKSMKDGKQNSVIKSMVSKNRLRY